MLRLRAHPLAIALLFAVAGCSGLDGGSREDAKAACKALCRIQEEAEGCELPAGACEKRCDEDAAGAATERCLLAAQTYYACGAEVSWTCPAAPDRPETEDARCAAEEHAWFFCKVTGELPPE